MRWKSTRAARSVGVVALAFACHTTFGAGADRAASGVRAEHPTPDAVSCAGTAERYGDGRLRQCELAIDTTFGGQPIPAGSPVTFRPDGMPSMASLAHESPVYGQPLPAATVLHFADGRLRHFWLPADTVIQGHLIRAQDDGAGSRLHPSGRLLAIWLARDEVIDGVPCTSSGNVLRMGLGVIRLGTMRMAWFRPSGRLQQCMLSRDVTLDGHMLRKGEVVGLDVDGQVDLTAEKLFRW